MWSKKIFYSLGFLAIIGSLFTGASCQKTLDGGVYKSQDQAENFEQKSFIAQVGKKIVSIADYDIREFIFDPTDPQIIYASTYGQGVFKSLNGAENWETTYFSSGTIRALAIDPQDTLKMYVGVDNNIYRTQDGGQGWDLVYTESNGSLIMGLLVDHYNTSQIYAFTFEGGVLKSSDYGVNWELTYQTSDYAWKVIMDPNDSRIMYALANGGELYRTLDGWTTAENFRILNDRRNGDLMYLFPGMSKIYDFTLDPNNSNTLYICSLQGLQKSSDRGETWEQLNTLIPVLDEENKSIMNIAVAPNNSSIMYFSVGRIIYKTTDGGASWKTLENFPSARNINLLVAEPQSESIIYVGMKAPVEEKKGLIQFK